MLDAFDKDVAFGARMLDALDVRTRTAVHNVANQNTPGFKRYEVKFEELLRDAAERDRDLGSVHAEVERDTSGPQGVNNVNVMEELALLDKVKILHDVFARRVGGYYGNIRRAIVGRAG